MQMAKDCAIKEAQRAVVIFGPTRIPILRYRKPRLLLDLYKRFMRGSQQLNIITRYEVKAMPKVYNRADYGWFLVVTASDLPLSPF